MIKTKKILRINLSMIKKKEMGVPKQKSGYIKKKGMPVVYNPITAPNTNNILEIKTVQTPNIKIVFEVLKDVIYSDINLIFTPTHIKSVEEEGLGSAIVYLNLSSKAFEYYHCKKNVIVAGINTHNIYKLIKTSGMSDIISFIISEDDEYVLKIRLENAEENRVSEYKFNLLDVPYEEIKIPSVDFNSTISMNSTKFQKIIKDFNSLGTDIVVKITIINEQISFECKSDYSNNVVTIGNNKNTVIDGTQEIVQNSYHLKFLVLFAKATSLSDTVTLYLKNDSPLFIEYSVGALGYIRFILDSV